MIEVQQMYHTEWPKEPAYVWEIKETSPFNEMIISWNANRTLEDTHTIFVSVLVNEWSKWIPYAEWSKNSQKSFSNAIENVVVYQDTLNIKNKEKGLGFRIKVESQNKLTTSVFKRFYVCCTDIDTAKPIISSNRKFKHLLSVSGLSQLDLNDPKSKRICSATSLTAVIRYLKGNQDLNPLKFSNGVWDSGFDIYGNWAFNVAHAYEELGEPWHCWVERFSSFDQIIDRLERNEPVVVSVKGILPTAFMKYNEGHLLAVIGYDSESMEVTCMDPAYLSDAETIVKYPLKDFLEVWSARRGLAYVLTRHSP